MSPPNTVLSKVLLEVVGPRAALSEAPTGVRARLHSKASLPSRIAVIGNYLPRHCGIATFTTDLCAAITAEYRIRSIVSPPRKRHRRRYDYPASSEMGACPG